MKKYNHLFFDLDRTLWDFNRNARETIVELYENHQLEKEMGINALEFFQLYEEINDQQWVLYRQGEITKDELRLARFHLSFMKYGFDNPKLALQFNDEYVANCSSKPNLIPNSIEILEYLQPRYRLSIITNGFKEAQYIKIDRSGLAKFFEHIIVSDELGYKKPDRRIFHHAMKKAGAKSANSLMIGDDYKADILGAKGVGMDQAFYADEAKNNQDATYTISSLLGLKEIL